MILQIWLLALGVAGVLRETIRLGPTQSATASAGPCNCFPP